MHSKTTHFFLVGYSRTIILIFSRDKPYIRYLLFNGFKVFLAELYITPKPHAIVSNRRSAGIDNNKIHDITTKTVIDTILHSLARTEHENQHKNTPEHAKGCKQCAQFILAQGK